MKIPYRELVTNETTCAGAWWPKYSSMAHGQDFFTGVGKLGDLENGSPAAGSWIGAPMGI